MSAAMSIPAARVKRLDGKKGLAIGIANEHSIAFALKATAKSPARERVSIDEVGIATASLAHDAARLMTGQVFYIDGGYHIID